MHEKRVPMRMCTGCGEMKPKVELVRLVKPPAVKDENGEIISEGCISIDLSGKKPGRGAYVCKNPECVKHAKKTKRFERVFSCKIEDWVYSLIEEELTKDAK